MSMIELHDRPCVLFEFFALLILEMVHRDEREQHRRAGPAIDRLKCSGRSAFADRRGQNLARVAKTIMLQIGVLLHREERTPGAKDPTACFLFGPDKVTFNSPIFPRRWYL